MASAALVSPSRSSLVSTHVLFGAYALLSLCWMWAQVVSVPAVFHGPLVVMFACLAGLAVWRPFVAVVLFIVGGVAVSGVYGLFPALFVGWYGRSLVCGGLRRERSAVELYVDVLAALVLVSVLFWQVRAFGVGRVPGLWLAAHSRDLVVPRPTEAAMGLLAGLMLFRVALSELPGRVDWRGVTEWFGWFTFGYLLLFKALHFPKLLFLFMMVPYWEFSLAAALVCVMGFVALRGWAGLATRAVLALPALYFLVIVSSRTLWLALGFVLWLGWGMSRGWRKPLALAACGLALLVALNVAPRAALDTAARAVADTNPALGVAVQDFLDLAILESRPRKYNLGQPSLLSNGVLSRLVIWERAVGMVAARPLTGTGVGTFYGCSPRYVLSPFGAQFTQPESAHNYFIQLAAEMGLPALAVLLLLLWRIARAAVSGLRGAGGEDAPALRWLMLSGLFLLVSNLWDHPLVMPNQQLLFWSIAALALAALPPGALPGPGRLDRRLLTALAALTALGYALALFSPPPC